MTSLLEMTSARRAACAREVSSRIPAGHFIDGDFRGSSGTGTLPLIHPGTGEETGRMVVGTAADVDSAVASARGAFDAGEWARRSPRERGRIVVAFADLIDAHRADLALLDTLDMGKPITDAYGLDVPKSANMIRWYGEAIDKQYGDVAPTVDTVHAYVRRAPLGVVACITPWNFPLYQAAYKLGPVLAAGNSLVIKPSELAPRSTQLVARLAVEAGIPRGVLNVVTGDGPTTGQALAAHPGIDALAFTGSTATARTVSRAAAASLAKLSIEAGGKSAHVVLPEAHDLDHLAESVVDGFCYNQGQVCSAGSRLLVHHSQADELVHRIIEKTDKYELGDPFETGSSLGPVVSRTQLERIRGHVATAVGQGATLALSSGDGVDLHPGGNWMTPVIVDDVRRDSAIAQQEVFGPVLAVLRYGSVDEAIDIANDTPYGLGAAVWSRDITRALTVAGRLRAGQVWVNNYDGADWTVPWGGFKHSGSGRDKSLEALAEFTGSTTTWIELGGCAL